MVSYMISPLYIELFCQPKVRQNIVDIIPADTIGPFGTSGPFY